MQRHLSSLLFALALVFQADLARGQDIHSGVLYPLSVATQSGVVTFQVEIAQSPAQLRRGLMFRETMPENQGMIFLHAQPKVLRMWMKNTLIPLDMLFIDQFGTIRHIAEDSKPHDETIISSIHAVVAVLEVNAGIAASRGIAIGDTVRLE